MRLRVSLKSKVKRVHENTCIRKHTRILAHKYEYRYKHKNNTLMCVHTLYIYTYKRVRTHNTRIRAHIKTRHTRLSYLMHI